VDFNGEFNKLNVIFSNEGVIREASLDFVSRKFFAEFKHRINVERHAEVAFAVERKNGKIIVIRTNFYPAGIYRIPTGGINFGEDVIDALNREIAEELGIKTEVKRFLGAVKYLINYKDENLNFYSFVFWVKELSGEILTDAIENEIGEFIEVDHAALDEICNNLKNNTSRWKDWCGFRLQTTQFILDYI